MDTRIMSTMVQFCSEVMTAARLNSLRTGQALFLHLPDPAGTVLAGSPIDPFHKELSEHEVYKWVEDHVIFNEVRVIALFNDNHILWEE